VLGYQLAQAPCRARRGSVPGQNVLSSGAAATSVQRLAAASLGQQCS